jgi:hypothetical protein
MKLGITLEIGKKLKNFLIPIKMINRALQLQSYCMERDWMILMYYSEQSEVQDFYSILYQ